MINNRQNGRRRGRGGPRPDGMQNRPNGGGNRPETRARGNAPQLHEKYKAMARDAQLAGDRVQTEYYLQFADHYYRILNENRPRFDESRPRQNDNGHGDNGQGDNGQDGGNDDYDDDEMMADEGGDDDAPVRQQQPRQRDARPERDERPQRDARPEREDRPQREERPQRDARPQREDRAQRDDRPQRDAQSQSSYVADGDDRPARPRRDAGEVAGEDRSRAENARDDGSREERPRVRTTRNGGEEGAHRAPRARAPRPVEDDKPGIDLERLPPAISRGDAEAGSVGDAKGSAQAGVSAAEDERPRPVRRPRRPREDTPAAA